MALGLWGGFGYALSGTLGIGMALLNLWLSARIIGGVADRQPELLAVAGMAGFALGLILLSVIAFLLRSTELVSFPITGFALVVSHLGLVLWEAATGGQPMEPNLTRDRRRVTTTTERRS